MGWINLNNIYILVFAYNIKKLLGYILSRKYNIVLFNHRISPVSSIIFPILDSKRSEECIGFTTMCFLILFFVRACVCVYTQFRQEGVLGSLT